MKENPTPNTFADLQRALLHYADGHELPAENIRAIMNAATALDRHFMFELSNASKPVRLDRDTAQLEAVTAAKNALTAGKCLTALHNIAHAERIRALELTLSTFKEMTRAK